MLKVSIICAARNEEKNLPHCIESLINQDYKNKEILIITDRSDDRTDEIAADYAIKYPAIVKHMVIPYVKGKGCVRPRVFGIQKSKGKVLCVVDADAVYAENYLSLCVAGLSDAKVCGVAGKLGVLEPKTFMSKYKDASYASILRSTSEVKKRLESGKMAVWVFKKEVYEKVGGYDERLAYGEDTDLTLRMEKAGYITEYLPEARYWRKLEPGIPETAKKMFKVGKLDFSYNKSNFKVWLKVAYFLFIPFSPVFLLKYPYLVLLYLPLISWGMILFARSGESTYRVYSLLAPIASIIVNVPYAFGFLSKVWSRK